MLLLELQRVKERFSFISRCLRFDADTTELHSWMTRSEVVLQSPEFAIYRKEGNLSELQEKVNVGKSAHIFVCQFVLACQSTFKVQI